MGRYGIDIRHPEWLEHSDPGRKIKLFNQGKLPKGIAGWMIVVACKYPLRAVYGSDLRAAWQLLLWALANKLDDNLWRPLNNAWHAVRYVYAWMITHIHTGFMQCPAWGRRDSPEPVRCECGWAGMRRWTIHTYQDDGSGEDVEPSDECPRCGQPI